MPSFDSCSQPYLVGKGLVSVVVIAVYAFSTKLECHKNNHQLQGTICGILCNKICSAYLPKFYMAFLPLISSVYVTFPWIFLVFIMGAYIPILFLKKKSRYMRRRCLYSSIFIKCHNMLNGDRV